MKIKVLDKNCIPKKAHSIDAGFDVKARTEFVIPPKETVMIPTGLCVEIPVGMVGLLFPRSSISKTPLRMCNSVGVIDSGFTGEIKVPLQNTHHNLMVSVNQYERIAQLVILPLADISLEIVDELDDTERGEGGFGSTGR